MTALLSGFVLLTATPAPTSRTLDESQVSPGLIGFLATFAIVLATVLLILDMTRRVRRLRLRQRAQEAELARRDAGSPSQGQSTD